MYIYIYKYERRKLGFRNAKMKKKTKKSFIKNFHLCKWTCTVYIEKEKYLKLNFHQCLFFLSFFIYISIKYFDKANIVKRWKIRRNACGEIGEKNRY